MYDDPLTLVLISPYQIVYDEHYSSYFRLKRSRLVIGHASWFMYFAATCLSLAPLTFQTSIKCLLLVFVINSLISGHLHSRQHFTKNAICLKAQRWSLLDTYIKIYMLQFISETPLLIGPETLNMFFLTFWTIKISLVLHQLGVNI